MTIEREQIPLDQMDFSVDPKLVERAKELLGPEVGRETAYKWIKSPNKEIFDRVAIGFLGSIPSTPLAGIGMLGVLIVDGLPPRHLVNAGFIGEGNETVGRTVVPKIRTLKRGASKEEVFHPFATTAFVGSRKHPRNIIDHRVHSPFGAFLRRTSLDELPQFWAVLAGRMAGVGPRPYTENERVGYKALFQEHDRTGNIFPPEVPDDYRQVISQVVPKGGLIGLYSATFRKGLTLSERLVLDHLYLTGANFRGDWNIILATVKVVAKGTGAG